MAKNRGQRKTILGTVVSDKMDKTITVREDRLVKHPTYGKYLRRSTTYKAHDERSEAREGDQVEIASTRPLSKTKSWRLVRILRKNVRADVELKDELAAADAAVPTAPLSAAAPDAPATPDATAASDEPAPQGGAS